MSRVPSYLLGIAVAVLLAASQLAAAEKEPLNLNEATAAQLLQLPGIGPKRAAEIIRAQRLGRGPGQCALHGEDQRYVQAVGLDLQTRLAGGADGAPGGRDGARCRRAGRGCACLGGAGESQ